MAIVKRLGSNGVWSDIGNTPLKTPVEIIEGGIALPDTITAGDTPVLISSVFAGEITSSSSLTATNASITIPIAGTYRFKWTAGGGGSSLYSTKTRLYKNGSAVGSEHTTTARGEECKEDIACNAGDEVTLYTRGYYYSGVYGSASGLVACIDWDNGF